MIETLSMNEIEEISAGSELKDVAEAFLVGAGVAGLLSGGNPLAAVAGGVVAVGILYL